MGNLITSYKEIDDPPTIPPPSDLNQHTHAHVLTYRDDIVLHVREICSTRVLVGAFIGSDVGVLEGETQQNKTFCNTL